MHWKTKTGNTPNALRVKLEGKQAAGKTLHKHLGTLGHSKEGKYPSQSAWRDEQQLGNEGTHSHLEAATFRPATLQPLPAYFVRSIPCRLHMLIVGPGSQCKARHLGYLRHCIQRRGVTVIMASSSNQAAPTLRLLFAYSL